MKVGGETRTERMEHSDDLHSKKSKARDGKVEPSNLADELANVRVPMEMPRVVQKKTRHY
jgi:hypothetical protein